MSRAHETRKAGRLLVNVVAKLFLAACLSSWAIPYSVQAAFLNFVEAQKDGLGGVQGLDGPRSVAVSPDGAHVYVASVHADAVTAFSRDPATGALTFIDVQTDGVGGVDGLDGAVSVTVSPDLSLIHI